MGIATTDGKVLLANVAAVEVRRVRRDAHRGIRRVTTTLIVVARLLRWIWSVLAVVAAAAVARGLAADSVAVAVEAVRIVAPDTEVASADVGTVEVLGVAADAQGRVRRVAPLGVVVAR